MVTSALARLTPTPSAAAASARWYAIPGGPIATTTGATAARRTPATTSTTAVGAATSACSPLTMAVRPSAGTSLHLLIHRLIPSTVINCTYAARLALALAVRPPHYILEIYGGIV